MIVPAVQAGRQFEQIVDLPDEFGELLRRIRYKALHGGRGSAKSTSAAIAILTIAQKRPVRVLCCREIQRSIKDSVKRLLEDIIKANGWGNFFISTQTEIRGANGTLILFEGLWANIDSIKSKEAIDIVWVDEAQSVSTDSLEKLIPTIRKPGSELWFTWNPDEAEDAVDYMFRGEGADDEPDETLIREYEQWALVKEVNWYDNPFFPDVLQAEMERDKRRDPDKYAHVWLGQYKQISEARVFHNWRIADAGEIEALVHKAERFNFGGDFGFSVDPTILIRNFTIGRTLYIDAEAYAVGCDIDYLPFLFGGCQDEDLVRLNLQAYDSLIRAQAQNDDRLPHGLLYSTGVPGARRWPIVADSARPETISYLKRHGFPQMVSAFKGPGSVEEGIEFLKAYDIVIHPRCGRTINEFTLYRYKVDKKTKQVLPVLADEDNHVIDGVRYSVEPLRRALGSFTATVGGESARYGASTFGRVRGRVGKR